MAFDVLLAAWMSPLGRGVVQSTTTPSFGIEVDRAAR